MSSLLCDVDGLVRHVVGRRAEDDGGGSRDMKASDEVVVLPCITKARTRKGICKDAQSNATTRRAASHKSKKVD